MKLLTQGDVCAWLWDNGHSSLDYGLEQLLRVDDFPRPVAELWGDVLFWRERDLANWELRRAWERAEAESKAIAKAKA